MKSFSSIVARWTRAGSKSSQCPTAPRIPHSCWSTHLAMFFALQITIAIAGCSKEIEETRLIRHEFLGGSTTGACNSCTIWATDTQIVARFSPNHSLRQETSTSDYELPDTAQPRDWRQNLPEAWQHRAWSDQYEASLPQSWNCRSSASCWTSMLRQKNYSLLHSSLDQALQLQTWPQREDLMVLILIWTLAPQHCCRPGFPQTELSSCTPCESIRSTGRCAKTGFSFLRLDEFSFNAERTMRNALSELFRLTQIALHCPFHESSLSNCRWLGCRRYFAANRLAMLLDEDDSRSSSRVHEHENCWLVSQLHVAIQTLWSQCLFPRAVWTNRWIVHFQQVSPCLFDLRVRFRLCLCLV